MSSAVLHAADETVEEYREGHVIPWWLVGLVGVLLVAVIGVGVYIIIRATEDPAGSQQAELITTSRQAVKHNPTETARLQLGYAYQRAGDYDRAREQYEIVIKQNPRNAVAYFNLGVLDEVVAQPEASANAYEKALTLDPTLDVAAKRLGMLLAKREQWKQIIAAIGPAVQAHPDMADLRFLLGSAYENNGDIDAARAEYRAALKYDPALTEAREALQSLKSE